MSRLIGITQSRNEQDIIEPWVRHHLKLLDSVYIFDGSEDDTPRILHELKLEFTDRIHLRWQGYFADRQVEQMNGLLDEALKESPDYVFPLDVDEFIGVDDRKTLESCLAAVPIGSVGLMYWQTYVVTPDKKIDDPPRSFTFRRKRESPPFSKVVIHCPCKGRLQRGNHSIENVSSTVELQVRLLHFPIRSRQQFESKSVVGWKAFLASDPSAATSGKGTQRSDGYEAVQRGQYDLCKESLDYAQCEHAEPVFSPIECFDYQRKYSDGQPMNAAEVIASAMQKVLPDPPAVAHGPTVQEHSQWM